jgi:GNAT superfamily N-acetyltransferase
MPRRHLREIAESLPPPNGSNQGAFRRWFYLRQIEVYLRVNLRIIDGDFVRTLELSGVEVDEDARGRGLFSRLLDGLVLLARERGEVLFVENVINDIVRGALLRRGFIDHQGKGIHYVAPANLEPNRKK